MSENHKAKAEAWQAVKFTLFSASAGLIQVVSFELLSKALKLPYWGSYLTALCLSILWNFTFNRRYTFRSDASVPRAMGLVALFYAVFTPLSTWGGSALTNGGWNAGAHHAPQFRSGISVPEVRGLPQPDRHQRRGQAGHGKRAGKTK